MPGPVLTCVILLQGSSSFRARCNLDTTACNAVRGWLFPAPQRTLRSSPQAVRLANFFVIFCLRPLAAVRVAFTSGLAARLPVHNEDTENNET